MKSITANEGSEITLTPKAFTRTGYTFAEWTTKTDGSGDKYADEDKIKLTANTTLYAQWTANTYTVKFDANGGIGNALTDIPAIYDAEFALPGNTFTKIGYNFAGWNTKANGNGKDYEAKANVKNLTAENGATVTLYAQWTDRGTHKINYELNGGNHSGTPTTTFKETDEVTLRTAERTGYTFGGWYEAEDFSGTAVTGWKAGEKTEDVTLYAQWTANKYTVKFDINADDATGTMESQTFTYGTSQALNENKFTRTGYDFVGWATSLDGDVTYNDKQDYSIGAENVTLYAKWVEKDKVTKVTFSYAGGEIDNGYTVTLSCLTEGATIYYVLVSGTQTPDLSKKEEYKAPITITDDITIVAVAVKDGMNQSDVATATFTVKTYTVIFSTAHGIAPTQITGLKKGSNLSEQQLPTLTVTGYKFDGWYNGETQFTTDTEITADITLTAKWELIITAENICNVIAGLPEGRHTISVTGEIPESKFTEIKEAINANINAKVNLDLSGVTGLSTIPSNAFSYCGNLVGIVIPETESGIKLGKEAFSGCSGLENIYLPKNIYMDDHEYVFSDCSSLSQVSFGGTMEEFKGYDLHFYEYPDIFKAAITFSDGNSWTMGKDIRDSAEENPEISYSGEWNDTIDYMLKKTLDYSSKRVNLLDLSKMTGLTEISSSTYLYLLNVVKLILPSCATKVCEGAFNYSKIESIVIPGNIKTIEDKAFGNSGVANSSLSNVEIGYGVESIGSYAFASCSALKNVKIPASVKNLADHVFSQCGALETAIIEASGTIGDNAFLNCKALKKVTLGPNVTGIGKEAFSVCTSLSEIIIPANVTSIGEWVFYQVPATSINYSGTMEQWSKIEKDNAFVDSSIKTIKCSDGDITL